MGPRASLDDMEKKEFLTLLGGKKSLHENTNDDEVIVVNF
jgi:hypothetical protein